MPKEKYQTGARYSNGQREIVFRYKSGKKVYFIENEIYDGMNASAFYSLGFEPLEQITTKKTPKVPKGDYRKKDLLFRLNEDA